MNKYNDFQKLDLDYQFTKDLKYLIKIISSKKRDYKYNQLKLKYGIQNILKTYLKFKKIPFSQGQIKRIYAIVYGQIGQSSIKAIKNFKLRGMEITKIQKPYLKIVTINGRIKMSENERKNFNKINQENKYKSFTEMEKNLGID